MNQADNEVELDTVEGERGVPSVNSPRRGAAKRNLGILFLGVVMLLGLGFTYFWFIRSQQADAGKAPPKSQQLESEVPVMDFADAPPPPPEAPQEAIQQGTLLVPAPDGTLVPIQHGPPGAPPAPRPTLDKSAATLMVVDSGSANAGASAAPPAAGSTGNVVALGPAGAGGRDEGGLAALLSGTSTAPALAGRLSDRNFTLAKGAFIDCVLQTKLDTTVPGMASCVVTRNIFSDNGNVVLIERGSTVIGEYSKGVQKGMNRIFVLWTRIKTPNGITMNLDSPGTDPLGASGLGGKVNRHFWQRFGAAMMLSLIDDVAATASRGSGNENTITYGSSSSAAQEMAAKTLESTINIPPTLYKNQGERINIFVARDLYFGNVYALRTY